MNLIELYIRHIFPTERLLYFTLLTNLQAFYGLHIEDMWLPYFCNTSNILTSRMEIHETGYAWRFISTFNTLQFRLISV